MGTEIRSLHSWIIPSMQPWWLRPLQIICICFSLVGPGVHPQHRGAKLLLQSRERPSPGLWLWDVKGFSGSHTNAELPLTLLSTRIHKCTGTPAIPGVPSQCCMKVSVRDARCTLWLTVDSFSDTIKTDKGLLGTKHYTMAVDSQWQHPPTEDELRTWCTEEINKTLDRCEKSFEGIKVDCGTCDLGW